MSTPTAAIILAAGEGTRMRSKLPKVLHPVGGLPMVAHVVARALERGCDPIVVVTSPEGRRVRELLSARFSGTALRFAVQEEQRGTGDATRAGLVALGDDYAGRVLVLYGDVPLLTAATIEQLQRAAEEHPVAFLSANVRDPTGYGRVVRERGRVVRIVEERDADRRISSIREINAGVYVCEAGLLRDALGGLRTDNAQGEYYLTDVIHAADGRAFAVRTRDVEEIQGVNDAMQLAEVEVLFRQRRVVELLERGVRMSDPNDTFIDADVQVEPGAVLGVGMQLYGGTFIGADAVIEGPAVLRDTVVEPGAQVLSFSHLEGVVVRTGARVGPFARLRPDTEIGEGARVGNFVEVKKSRLAAGAKANHLAYVGDAEIGAGANIGAGTITCNYDGGQKHPTDIGAGAFVGSNSTLVAPLTIGEGAYIAAGSTITRDVAADALAFGRARQEARAGYASRLRRRLGAAVPAAANNDVPPADGEIADADAADAAPRGQRAKAGKGSGAAKGSADSEAKPARATRGASKKTGSAAAKTSRANGKASGKKSAKASRGTPAAKKPGTKASAPGGKRKRGHEADVD